MDVQSKIYKIKGMHCASCISSVEKLIKSIQGVDSAVANLALEKVKINFNEVISINEIKEKLQSNGFQLIDELIEESNENHQLYKNNQKLLLICILGSFLFIYSMGSMFFHLESNWYSVLIQFFLVSPIVILCRSIYINGLQSIKNKKPNMNSLIAIGTLSAYIYSIISSVNILFKLEINAFGKIYFESAGIILLFISIGRFIESRAKQKANSEILKLLENIPQTGFVKKKGEWKELSIDEINVGDIVMIKPGGKVPVDGIVIKGESYVNESVITGESNPIKKNLGDNLIGSSINSSGTLIMKADKVGSETILSKIIHMVEKAQNSKAPIQTFADKIASIFVPMVLLLSVSSFVFWIIKGYSFTFSFNTFISVLIIACPCALGLATPIAIVVGSGIGANLGIHFKSSESLQILSDISSVVFDKTGTLTIGQPKVLGIKSKLKENEFIQLLASLENESEHTIAKAIMDIAQDEKINIIDCNNTKTVSGLGIQGEVNGKSLKAGNLEWLQIAHDSISSEYLKTISKWDKQGYSIIYVSQQNEFIGIVAISDPIRSDAKFVVENLIKNKIGVNILTGDRNNTAKYIADELGIKNFNAELLPNDKVKKIQELQAQGHKVLMVGDGINDAPALASAEIGISIGSGTDIAIESSDIVIVQDKLVSILNAIKLSKSIVKKIKQNLFWAFLYNIIGIPIAMGFFYPVFGYLLNPIIAGGAMALSSISVILNTLLLRKNIRFN